MSTGKRVKEGILRRYKKNMLGGKWKECKAVLYEDSTFVWYEMGNESEPEMVLNLKQVAPFFAVGLYASRLPNRPQLPSGSKLEHAMAFGTGPSKDAKIFWFLCHNDDDLNAWMASIVSTLPPPPQPPQQQQQQPMPPPAYNQGAPPPSYYPGQPGNAQPGLPPPPAWAQNMNYPRPQATQAQGPTTVVVAPSPSSSHSSGWGSTAAGVGTGMLVGGLTGYALGSMMTPHWGHGYGYGGGWGGGYGYGHGGGYYSDNDTTIINNYNTTNNDYNQFNDSGTASGGGDGGFSYGGGDGGDNFDYGGDSGGGFDDGGGFDFGGDDGGGFDFGGD